MTRTNESLQYFFVTVNDSAGRFGSGSTMIGAYIGRKTIGLRAVFFYPVGQLGPLPFYRLERRVNI